MELLLKGGVVIDPFTKTQKKLDLLIKDNIIIDIREDISEENRKVIDVEGKIVAPGFIDIHVHLREPGFEHKETIKTGTMAAAAGGFTTVACMPNTKPAIHSKEVVDYIKEKSKKDAIVNVEIIGSISKDLEGEKASSIHQMVEAGIIAISDDGKTPMDEQLMIDAFKEAKKYNIPLISHCEDHELSKGGSVNLGYASKRIGDKGISSASEYLIVERDIMLCEKTNSKLHIAHVSTKEAVDIIRRAKEKGINVTCEAAPHHFILSDDIVTEENTNTKVNPPLRSKEDVKAIVEGILDGTIDIIATDHAPHDKVSKTVSYSKAAFGISGLETAFSLSYQQLVLNNKLSLMRLIEMMTIKPAKIIGIDRGSLQIGRHADLVVLDLDNEEIIDSSKFYSMGKNTPFNGIMATGKPIYTIVNGQIVFDKENYLERKINNE